MTKQKSYVVTDEADEMAASLAERNGLSKSAIIEILLRQAYAAGWSVSSPPSTPNKTEAHRYCRARTAAYMLGVTESAVSAWAKAGKLKFHPHGSQRRYREDEILAFAAENGKALYYQSFDELLKDNPYLKL